MNFQFHEGQKEVASDIHRFRVACCGRRFGKTTLATYEMLGKGVAKDGRNIVYLAPTYQQARDIIWGTLVNLAAPITLDKNESRLELTIATRDAGKSLIKLRGWESVETLRGQAFDFMVPDEVASYRGFWSAWFDILRPTLTDRKGEVLFLSTPKGFNHFYELFGKEATDPDFKSFHFTSYDNPFLPKEELEKAKLELPEDRFSQEYMADFRKTTGLVYKEFDRSKHLVTDEQVKNAHFVEIIAGVDFGTTNPACCLTLKKDHDENWWVTKEYYKRGNTDVETAEYVAGSGFNKVYPDPENPGAIKELRNRGVNVRDVIKGRDSVKNGINIVRELFKANKLKIHKSCENLIYELETYSYPEKKDFKNDDENPIKENDHAMDALRYPLMMQGSDAGRVAHTFYPHAVRNTNSNSNPVSSNGRVGETSYPSFIRQ